MYSAMQDAASAVAVIAAAVVVAAMSVAIVQKVAQRVAAASAVNEALNNATQSLVVSNVTSSEANNAVRARSSASRAHLVSPVSPAKAAVRSVHAANEANEAANNVQRWMPLSKTLPWLTRQRWPRLLAARHQTPRRMRHVVNVAIAVVATTAAQSRVKIAKTSVMQHLQSKPLART